MMDIQIFLDNFAHIINTSNGVSKLKEILLQLAIRGQLVTQKSKDGNASQLLDNINGYKNHLIESRKIKKTKKLPSIQNHEKIFEIPENWIWVRLGDIGNWGSGSTPDRQRKDYYDGNVPWFKSGELNNGVISESEETITELALKECSLRLNQPGDVLIAIYGASIGKLAIQMVHGTTNQAVCACTCYQGIFNWWLFFVLQAYKSQFIEIAEGGAQPNISRIKIINTVVALPPLKEQKRIVSKIEELIAICDELKNQQQNATTLTTNIRKLLLNTLVDTKSSSDIFDAWQTIQSNFSCLFASSNSINPLRKFIYDMACTGYLSPRISLVTPVEETINTIKQNKLDLIKNNQIKQMPTLIPVSEIEEPAIIPKTWRWIRLGEICKAIDYGTSHKAHSEPEGVPILSMGNIVDGKIDFRNPKYVDSDIKDLPRLFLKNGDLIFNRTNSYDLVGKMGLFTEENDKYTLASYLIRISIFDEYIIPEWVHLFFQSSICRKTQIDPIITAQTNQANINGTKLVNILIPIAPLEEQRDIIKQVEKYLNLCDELENKLKDRDNKQILFSRVSISGLLDTASNSRLSNEEVNINKYLKKFSVEIQLVSPVKQNIEYTKLSKILKSNGGQMEAKELWKASELGIDEFYALLKQEIDDGFIQKPDIAELKLVEVDE